MCDKTSSEKRIHEDVNKKNNEENQNEDVKKRKIQEEFCAFWIEKKNRNCFTKPVEGFSFCQSHLDKTPDIRTAKVFDVAKSCENILTTKEKKTNAESEKEKIRCRFWLARKKRYCKCIPPKDNIFCIEHTANNEDNVEMKRIPCPLDSKHSCYEKHLQSHLKKCNSQPSLNPIFYEKNLNSGDIELLDVKNKIGTVEVSDLMNTILKVNALYLKYEFLIGESEQGHVLFEESLNDPTNGLQATKHLKQIASLIGNLQCLSLLQPCHTYIEFGAGRGGLSHWIQKANPDEDCRFILIDRSSVRYKKDNFHKGEDQGPSFERIKIDIEHLALGKIESLKNHSNDITCVGKHLCGAATDFMIRCIVNSKESVRVKGLVLALCCHHRCTWGAYVGRKWMGEEGMGAGEFDMMVKMSAWATCGTKHVDETHKTADCEFSDVAASNYSHPRYGGLLPQERQEIGFKCKRLIDIGRLKCLHENNYNCHLIKYVSTQTTLENLALTAVYGVNK